MNVTLPSMWIVARPTLLADNVPLRKEDIALPLNVALRVANDKLVIVTLSTTAPWPPGVSDATPACTVVDPTRGGPAGLGLVVEIWFSTIVSLISCFRPARTAGAGSAASQPIADSVNNSAPTRLKAATAQTLSACRRRIPGTGSGPCFS